MNATELKELLANATTGPWSIGNKAYPSKCIMAGQYLVSSHVNESNARLIALAPQLAADNIALQAEVERLRQTVEDQAQALRQEKEEVDRMRPLW